jgi:phi13 family phage major tail protein
MAFIGLRYPYIAKYNRSTKSYSDGYKYSKAVSVNVTPNYAEASLYADDTQEEYAKSFTNATVQLGTAGTPIQAASTVFGHTVDTANHNRVIYKATDEANEVGVGFVAVEQVSGETKYVASVITCAKFTESQQSLTTKGEQLQFSTPTIEGRAITDEDGRWKITEVYDTAEAAEDCVRSILNIPDEYTYTPVTPVGTENPSEEGWYERSGSAGSYVYTLSEDTEVDSEKTYYVRS